MTFVDMALVPTNQSKSKWAIVLESIPEGMAAVLEGKAATQMLSSLAAMHRRDKFKEFAGSKRGNKYYVARVSDWAKVKGT